jgi:RimJ/RimL family protein N-acetyltransferase
LIVLSTERLVLRHLTAEDADFILALMNDPDWLRYIGDRGIRTADDARGYIATGPVDMYARLGFGLYAVELREDGIPIGICGLIRRDWLEDVDLGFAFLPRFRGAGYAYEAAAATVEHARAPLGLDRLMAIVSPENEDSVRLLGKLGMTFERMAQPPGAGGQVCVFGRALG